MKVTGKPAASTASRAFLCTKKTPPVPIFAAWSTVNRGRIRKDKRRTLPCEDVGEAG